MIDGVPPELWALLPLGAAAGLDLHLLVLFLGMAPLLGWDAPPPGGLGGLAYPPALVLAAFLYVVEGTVERSPVGSLVWNAVHLMVRPLAAGLLALLLLQDAPPAWMGAGAAVAGAVALATQWARSGWRLLLDLTDARTSTGLVASAAEDATALALAALVLDQPAGGALLTVLLLGLAGLRVRPYLEAFTFGLHLLRSRTLGLLDRSSWRNASTLPASARRRLSPGLTAAGATGTVRATPAALLSPGRSAIFSRGWLIQAAGAFHFLPGVSGGGLDLGGAGRQRRLLSARTLYHRMEIRGEEEATLLLLPKGGPDPGKVADPAAG